MDPLDYLVADCWRHLFKFLSAEDKQALGDTCETFHAMLQPQKVEWGIELILPHITKYILHPYIDRNQQLSFNLKCRQVCKSWRVTFDKVCGSIPSGHPSSVRNKYYFQDDSTLENFLNFFKDHRGNPFIGRRVTISATPLIQLTTEEIFQCLFEEPEANEEGNAAAENDENEKVEHNKDAKKERVKRKRRLKYRELRMELLLSFGEEIEHLTVNSYWNPNDYENSVKLDELKFLQLVLCNTPNLQSLRLDIGHFCNEPENSTIQTAISEYFELNPLPKRPILRELTLPYNHPKIKTLLLEAYGENLQILRMNSVAEIPLSVWSSMKCLKKLELSCSDFSSHENIFRALHSPLEILFICERDEIRNSDQFFMIDKFLLAVQHLPLKKIEVAPACNNVKESAPFPADFPKHFTITELTFRLVRSTSVNFLQFLPNLQKQVVIERGFSFLSNDIFRQMMKN